MNSSQNPLSKVLRAWRVAPPVEPNFRDRVWQRIGGQAKVSWRSYLGAHATAWSVAALMVLGAAAYTGHAAASARMRVDRDALVVTYLVDLDPRVQAMLKPTAR